MMCRFLIPLWAVCLTVGDSAESELGPAWFDRMDRNRDGDVSPREFLGGGEAFRKLDVDGDGLISVDEAHIAAARHAAGPARR